MDREQFKLSVQLFKVIGQTRLSSGKSLREELQLGQNVSFWDILAPYLVLYRFSLLFKSDANKSIWREWLMYNFRPLKGLAAQIKDVASSLPCQNAKLCKQWPADKRVALFLGFTSTFYRDVLRPVAEALTKENNVRVIVLEHNSFWGHWNKDIDKLTQGMLKRARALQKMLTGKNQLSVLIKGFPLGSFQYFALSKEFDWIFWRELKRLIPMFAVAKHILEKHQPALIVSADDADQRCKIYSLLAKEEGIPALLVQQGLTDSDYPEWLFFSQSKIAAMGESSASDIASQGVSRERIVVTGNPGFDNLVLPEIDACFSLRKKLGLVSKDKMVLFASQPYCTGVFNAPDMRRTMIKAIAEAVTLLKDVKLIIKPHPGDNIRELKELMGKFPQVVMLDRKADISLLIKACDVLVTFFSTVALQALYTGKPVINVNFPGSGGMNLYSESGATWEARSTEEIAAHIQRLTGENKKAEILIREPARQSFFNRMAYSNDGKATERVLRVVSDMLQLA